MKKNSQEFSVDNPRLALCKIGEGIFKSLGLEAKIMEAANSRSVLIDVPIDEQLTKNDAHPLALFLISKGFLIQDHREDPNSPRISVCWY